MWQTGLTVLPDLPFSKYFKTFSSFLKAWAPEVLKTSHLPCSQVTSDSCRELAENVPCWLRHRRANHHLLVLILLFLDHPHWVSSELQFLVWLVGKHSAHRKVSAVPLTWAAPRGSIYPIGLVQGHKSWAKNPVFPNRSLGLCNAF